MITLNYKINTDLAGRTAAQLNWNLNKLSSSLYIITKEKRMVNGKSLVGLLQGNIRNGDLVTILLDKEEDLAEAKSSLNNIGKQF